jgi:hypothetical protein
MTMSDSVVLKMADPDSVDWEIRIRLARILSRITEKSEKIYELGDFYVGICTCDVFRRRIKDEWKKSFYIRPLHTFKQATDNIIKTITARFYEIAAIPVVDIDDQGKKTVDHKNARLLLDVAKLLLDRKLGAAVQRNVTLKGSVPANTTPAEDETEIKALEAEFAEQKQKRIPGVAKAAEEGKGTITVSGK